jgi:hypothetical protein
MKRNVLIVAAVMLLFSFVAIIGCKPNKAIQYNDNLINHQQKVIAKMIDLSKTFVKKDRVSMSMKLTELRKLPVTKAIRICAMPCWICWNFIKKSAAMNIEI